MNRHRRTPMACLKGATSGLMHCSKQDCYSITSSTRASSEGGIESHIRGLEIKDELELCWLHTGHFCGVCTLENLADVFTSLAVHPTDAWSKAHEPTCRRKLAHEIHGGYHRMVLKEPASTSLSACHRAKHLKRCGADRKSKDIALSSVGEVDRESSRGALDVEFSRRIHYTLPGGCRDGAPRGRLVGKQSTAVIVDTQVITCTSLGDEPWP
jgi:hypothetical protein